MAATKLKPGAWEATDKLPDLSNATPPYLADELGDIRAEIKRLQKLEGLYKDVLEAKKDPEATTVEGDKWCQVFEMVSQMRINADLCRQHLDAETLAKVTAEVSYRQIKSVRKAGT